MYSSYTLQANVYKVIIPVLLWLNVAMPDCQNKESGMKELTDLYEVPFKIKKILQ